MKPVDRGHVVRQWLCAPGTGLMKEGACGEESAEVYHPQLECDGGCGWRMLSCSAPGCGSATLAPGALGGFQSQHREGGVGSSEAPLQKDSLVLSLPVGTTCSAWGHLPSRRRMQTSLLDAAEVIIGVGRGEPGMWNNLSYPIFFLKACIYVTK